MVKSAASRKRSRDSTFSKVNKRNGGIDLKRCCQGKGKEKTIEIEVKRE